MDVYSGNVLPGIRFEAKSTCKVGCETRTGDSTRLGELALANLDRQNNRC